MLHQMVVDSLLKEGSLCWMGLLIASEDRRPVSTLTRPLLALCYNRHGSYYIAVRREHSVTNPTVRSPFRLRPQQMTHSQKTRSLPPKYEATPLILRYSCKPGRGTRKQLVTQDHYQDPPALSSRVSALTRKEKDDCTVEDSRSLNKQTRAITVCNNMQFLAHLC